MPERLSRRTLLLGAAAMSMAGAPAWSADLVPAFTRTPRIAFGGIACECSTYSRIRTTYDEFDIQRGDALAASPRFAFLKRYEVPFIPTIVAAARSSGAPIERSAYERIKAEFLDRIRAVLPLDGVYLPMHGALYVDGMEDAEGDWYEALRGVVGPNCLLSASYDLHGNISRRIVDTLDAISGFRTAPHVDKEETMIRATDMLTHCLRDRLRPTIVWATIPVALPGEKTSTEWEPGRRLWADLSEYNRLPGILDVTQLVGYVWADEPRSAASVLVTGFDAPRQTRIAAELAARYWDARAEFHFGSRAGTVEECIAIAMASKTHPVVISDSGDNPGGGGNADQANFLQALLKAGATDVLLGGMTDRPATDACYAAGVGKTIPLSIGATLDPQDSTPVKARATVRFLAPTDDPAMREAVIAFDGITMTLSAHRKPYHEVWAFTNLGVDPRGFKIVVLKCGYLAPTMKPIANPALMALSSGAIDQDIVYIANRRRVPTYPWVHDLTYHPRPYLSARSRLPERLQD